MGIAHDSKIPSGWDRKFHEMQQQIEGLMRVIAHLERGPAHDPIQIFPPEVADALEEAIDEEDARRGAVAWDIVLDYLSRQWLPPDVKAAYDHISKGLEYDA